MWFNLFWHRWLGHTRPRACGAGRRRRPCLETLEDRTLPSNFNAANVAALVADINALNARGGVNTIALTADLSAPYDLVKPLPAIARNDKLTIVGKGQTIERSTAAATPAVRLFPV